MGDINRRQYRAIVIGLNLGRELQADMPEIAKIYFSGKTYREIEEIKEISTRYTTPGRRVSKRLACVAISHAIRGHQPTSDGYGVEPYPGLITDDYQLEMMRRRHLCDSGRRSLRRLEAENRGLTRIPTSERTRYGVSGAVSRGFMPWLDRIGDSDLSEKDVLTEEFNDPKNRYGPGKHYGQPMLEKITMEHNRRVHNGRPVRSRDAIRLVAIELRNDGRILTKKEYLSRAEERLEAVTSKEVA